MKVMNSSFIFFILISNIILLLASTTKYEIPMTYCPDTGLPTVDILLNGGTTWNLILDIGQEKSCIYNEKKEEKKDEKNMSEIKYKNFSLKGENKKGQCLLSGKDSNENYKVDAFEYLEINNKKGDELFWNVMSLNNIIMGNEKNLGFNLDFPSQKLFLGELFADDKEKENFNKLELSSTKREDKWKLNLTAVFFDKIELNIKNADSFKITNETLGIMVNKNIVLETVYSSFFVPRDFFAFLETHYFYDGKEQICQREIKDGNIVYLCNKNNKGKIKDINLVLNNKLVLPLTSDNLLKCPSNSDVCEFIIRYDPKINDFSLGIDVLKNYNIYFMKNENNIYLDKGVKMFECDLADAKFNVLGKKDKMQALFQLLKTFSVIVIIFIFLFIFFYIHSKVRGHVYADKENDDKKEEMVDIQDKGK